eukprot:TRINITY_DN18725_c0_g1_i3.p1 TRINITY_DN18725_c0_g1~~TRINITY_DN18725_c0_g1_i3.p1  ORF type:complete len:295 (-),score=32.79 TRINITY_DN18725_c0_g1_i3:513-1397(-)
MNKLESFPAFSLTRASYVLPNSIPTRRRHFVVLTLTAHRSSTKASLQAPSKGISTKGLQHSKIGRGFSLSGLCSQSRCKVSKWDISPVQYRNCNLQELDIEAQTPWSGSLSEAICNLGVDEARYSEDTPMFARGLAIDDFIGHGFYEEHIFIKEAAPKAIPFKATFVTASPLEISLRSLFAIPCLPTSPCRRAVPPSSVAASCVSDAKLRLLPRELLEPTKFTGGPEITHNCEKWLIPLQHVLFAGRSRFIGGTLPTSKLGRVPDLSFTVRWVRQVHAGESILQTVNEFMVPTA